MQPPSAVSTKPSASLSMPSLHLGKRTGWSNTWVPIRMDPLIRSEREVPGLATFCAVHRAAAPFPRDGAHGRPPPFRRRTDLRDRLRCFISPPRSARQPRRNNLTSLQGRRAPPSSRSEGGVQVGGVPVLPVSFAPVGPCANLRRGRLAVSGCADRTAEAGTSRSRAGTGARHLPARRHNPLLDTTPLDDTAARSPLRGWDPAAAAWGPRSPRPLRTRRVEVVGHGVDPPSASPPGRRPGVLRPTR